MTRIKSAIGGLGAVSATVAVAASLGVTAPAAANPSARPAAIAMTRSSPVDWKARWIGRDTPKQWPQAGEQSTAPLLRRHFALGKRVAKAQFSIVGLGYYEAWINGLRVGDQVLDPPPSAYDKTAYSRTFDVTHSLREGGNAIAVTLGRSYFATPTMSKDLFGLSNAPWRAEPRLLAQLDIVFSDGTTQRVISDGKWKISDGPTRDSLALGEQYDARQARPGWTGASYDDSRWQHVHEQPAPTQKVVPAGMPPVRVTGMLNPVKVIRSAAGTQVYDFGRDTAGWARITVRGTPGTTVKLTYGEQLKSDGTVYQSGVTTTAALTHVDSYTLGGRSTQTWEPSFTRHGFRYVEVATSAPLTSFRIQGRVVHSDLASTGSFRSASKLLNTIHENQQTSLLSNLWGIPTDTPWRDRQGWTADGYLYLDSASLNFDVQQLYTQWLRSWRDSQQPDGSLPVVAPDAGGLDSLGISNDPSWSGALIPTVWNLYQYYGSPSVLRDNYDAMVRWMDLMRDKIAETGGLYTGFSFGDWATPGSEANNNIILAPPEGSELTASADLYHEARLLAKIAKQLGHTADAARFTATATGIETAFNAKFLDADAGVYRTTRDVGYRQTSNLVALAYGLVPKKSQDAVFANLVKDIINRGTRLNTGGIGTKLLLPVLSDHGRGDLAYALATQTEYPSWGNWVKSGASTSWETWSIGGPDQSMNHPFLGTIDDWFYGYLAGIRPAAPGYSKVLISPLFPAGLDSASATVTTAYGKVTSSWKRHHGKVTLTVQLPKGSQAEFRIPSPDRGPATASRGTTLVKRSDGQTTYTAGSGTYTFTIS